MLYGHIEEPRHRVDHVLRLRELQDETGGFQVFIPLRYQHDFVDSKDGKVRNRLQARTTMATRAEALKTFAVSRLLFDNVPHVKVLLGDARPVDRRSSRCSTARTTWTARSSSTRSRTTPTTTARPTSSPATTCWSSSGTPGFRPVERNTRYEIIREYDPAPSLAERRAQPQEVWVR